MPDAELVSALIGQIYDAALDPSLWPDTLRQLASYVGGSAASLFAKDAVGRSVDVYHDDGALDRDWLTRYRDEYIKYDPSTVRQFFAEVGQSVATADIMPYPEFAGTRFSAEWAQPQHLLDSLTAVLEKSGPKITMFTVFRERGDGFIDGAMRQRMADIIPHLRRAALVAATLANAAREAAAMADTLDALEASVFVLDSEGHVIHANAAGRTALANAALFRRSAHRLSPVDIRAERALSALLAGLREGRLPPAEDAAFPMVGPEGELHVVHAIPLGGRTKGSGLPGSAALAVFVRPAALGAIAAPQALARAYQLTPSELRVLLAIVEVGGAPEVADTLGIAESTVKFHLKRLFAKTEARRQADLVKIVAGFTSPIIG